MVDPRATDPPPSAPLHFGRFELQPHEHRLLADGQPQPLGARAFELLLVLARRAGQLVTKAELMELVWPGRYVEENNLAAQVSALRKVLGEGVIATIPGRGYRFVARLRAAAGEAAGEAAAAAAGGDVRDAGGAAEGAGEASAGAAGAPDAGPGSAALRTNLPPLLPALLGRDAELQALQRLLEAQRLVSVVGAGGIGKSLLVLHLLERSRAAYPHGVCWVELAPIDDAAALPGAIGAALGAEVSRGGDALAALASAVRPLAMLLAIDDAEHLLDAVAPVVQALHDAAPRLRIVVTSQAPLKLKAEQVLRIEPLAVPPRGLPADEARRWGAVALFEQRARAHDARFVLTDALASTVIEICRTLDGLPLAIELAAARVPALGVQPLLAAMQHRLALLTSSRDRDAPPRQRTLRATLDWSHAGLTPLQQRVFRRCAVVAGSGGLALLMRIVGDGRAAGGGGVRREEGEGDDGGEAGDGAARGAAEVMPPDATIDDWAALDALDALVDRSLLVVLDAAAGAAPRYRLLESARAYAAEMLHAAGETAAVQQRHALAMASILDAEYQRYFAGSVGVDDWQLQLGMDLDNAVDAWRFAHRRGDAPTAATIGATLLRALPPSRHAERMALADALQGLLLIGGVPDALLRRGWIELSCAWADTQKQRAREAAERALELARAAPAGEDRFGLYHALARAASAAAQRGDLPQAAAWLAELQPLEDPRWPPQRLVWGSEAAQVLARFERRRDDALALSRRLLDLDRRRGTDSSIALGNLIDAELARGDAAAAARTGAELVAALRQTRHVYTLAFAEVNLCSACLALDDIAGARRAAEEGWPLAADFELDHALAAYLALLAALEGRAADAARLIGGALALYASRDDVIESNEAAAIERARSLAIAALGRDGCLALEAQGARLSAGEVRVVGLGRGG